MLTNSVKGIEMELNARQEELLDSARETASQEDIVNMTERRDSKALIDILPRMKTLLGASIVRVVSPEGFMLADGNYTTADVKAPHRANAGVNKDLVMRALKGEDIHAVLRSDTGMAFEAFVRIKSKGKPVGVLEVARLLDYDFLNQIIKAEFAVDAIIYGGGLPQATTFTDPKIIQDDDLKILLGDVLNRQKKITKDLTLGGSRFYVTAIPIEYEKDISGVLMLALSSEKAFHELRMLEIALLMSIAVLIFITYFISRRMSLKIVRPIESLCNVTQEVAKGSLSVSADVPADVKSRDEIGILACAFNKMIEQLRIHHHHLNDLVEDRTRDLMEMNAELEAEIYTRTKIEGRLHDMNAHLEERVAEEIDKIRQQEQMLIQQSKMASMGEMIAAIAHQWRQPLNAIGLIVQDMEDAYEFGEFDKKYLSEAVEKTMTQIRHMSGTIDDFRNFFKPSKEKVIFKINTAVKGVIYLMYDQLTKANIRIAMGCNYDAVQMPGEGKYAAIYTCEPELTALGYPNEFKQAVLNLLGNARDAILDKRRQSAPAAPDSSVEGGKILVELSKKDHTVILEIQDDGGGIPVNVIGRIFEPYFTTKKNEGTGIGLHMSKVIVEQNMGGRIYASNGEKGAVFTIELPFEGIKETG
jgi:signal transduction histidine kinase